MLLLYAFSGKKIYRVPYIVLFDWTIRCKQNLQHFALPVLRWSFFSKCLCVCVCVVRGGMRGRLFDDVEPIVGIFTSDELGTHRIIRYRVQVCSFTSFSTLAPAKHYRYISLSICGAFHAWALHRTLRSLLVNSASTISRWPMNCEANRFVWNAAANDPIRANGV